MLMRFGSILVYARITVLTGPLILYVVLRNLYTPSTLIWGAFFRNFNPARSLHK